MNLDIAHASILVVDDDERNRLALRELLDAPGQAVVFAASGTDALRCVLKQEFAVILMDARMPGMDGFEAARMIRERERSRHTPIIFLTGAYEDPPSMFRGYEAGAVDYLVKPLIPEVLRSKVSIFVELYNKNAVLTREIAERKRVEQHLRASEDNLRALAARLQSVREEEWKRIAREIHDELGQALTGLKMDVAWIAGRLLTEQAPLLEKTRSMSSLIDQTVQSVRRLASRLRPEVLDEMGLAAAIQWQARDFQMRAGIRCKIDVPSGPIEMDPERATAVFRIFQELLTNVARHAAATKIEVSLRLAHDTLVLGVRDNGRGIEQQELSNSQSLGLLGMRERVLPFGGRVEIVGKKGNGTRAAVSIPIGSAAGSGLSNDASLF